MYSHSPKTILFTWLAIIHWWSFPLPNYRKAGAKCTHAHTYIYTCTHKIHVTWKKYFVICIFTSISWLISYDCNYYLIKYFLLTVDIYLHNLLTTKTCLNMKEGSYENNFQWKRWKLEIRTVNYKTEHSKMIPKQMPQ